MSLNYEPFDQVYGPLALFGPNGIAFTKKVRIMVPFDAALASFPLVRVDPLLLLYYYYCNNNSGMHLIPAFHKMLR